MLLKWISITPTERIKMTLEESKIFAGKKNLVSY